LDLMKLFHSPCCLIHTDLLWHGILEDRDHAYRLSLPTPLSTVHTPSSGLKPTGDVVGLHLEEVNGLSRAIRMVPAAAYTRLVYDHPNSMLFPSSRVESSSRAMQYLPFNLLI
jgi:hypothetical protein